MEEIKLTNGSKINIINSDESIRSKSKEHSISDFYESYLGVKLNKWQKIMIESVHNKDILIVSPQRNGRFMTNVILKILYKDKLNQEELDWCKQYLSEEVYNNLLDNTDNL